MTANKKNSNHTSSKPDRGLFYALLLLVVWLPLPLGSNRPWAWSLMEAWIFIMAAGWCLGYARGRLRIPSAVGKAKPALILLILWQLLLTLQLIPLPANVIETLSPEAARMHALAQSYSGTPGWMTLTVDPAATTAYWFKALAYMLLFLLTLLLVRNRRRMKLLAYALVYSGLFQAVYGSVMTLTGIGHLFVDSANLQASGTFINRNHLAGYLEMTLATGIGLLIAGLEGGRAASWRQRLRDILKFIFSPKMRLRIYLAVMVIALVLTHSRMGNTAFFASLLIAGVIGLALSRHATRATVILLVSLILIDLLIVGTWFGIERVAERLEQTTLAAETRDEVDLYSVGILEDYPLFGTGGGSYYTAFTRYRGLDVPGFYDHAHNDYLEIASDTGLIGLGLMGVFVLLALIQALKAQASRRDPLARGMAFAALMAIAALLIHSTVDFNLQIPANAATFVLLLALAWLSAHQRKPGSDPNFR